MMYVRTLRPIFAQLILATIMFVLVACGLATAADSATISVAALQGSFTSFNVPDGQGGTLPTGTWYMQQIGPGTWTFDASTGLDTFTLPLQATFPGLPGSPSTQINLTEKGIFQFAQDEQGNLAGQGANFAVFQATIPGAPGRPYLRFVSSIDYDIWWSTRCLMVEYPPPASLNLQAFPTGFTTFPAGTLPPNGQLPPFGTDGMYQTSGFIQVTGVPGAQHFTGTGPHDTAPLSSGSMTQANEFQVGASGSVSEIDVAVGFASGTNSFYVNIAADNNGQPGTVLASFTNLSSSATFGTCCGLVSITGVSGLNLSAGTNYWLVVGPSDINSTTSELWNLNSIGATGSALYSTDGGLTWISRGQQTLGAFQLLGGRSTLFSDLGTGENVYVSYYGLQVSGSGAGLSKSLASKLTK